MKKGEEEEEEKKKKRKKMEEKTCLGKSKSLTFTFGETSLYKRIVTITIKTSTNLQTVSPTINQG